MTIKEIEPRTTVTMFDDPRRYNQYLQERGVEYRLGSRAKGFLDPDGSIEVVIDKSYYLQRGIRQEQLPALAEHERIALASKDPDPHLPATIGEYRYIFEHFGEKGLKGYHACLCNLMGGINDIRNLALKTVLGK